MLHGPGLASNERYSAAHGDKYMLLLALLAAVGWFAMASSEPRRSLDMLDVFGESLAFAGVLTWLPITLAWRPRGWVTDWLFAGISLLAAGCLLDLLDELYTFSALRWGSLESIAMPAGIIVIALALHFLRQEQRVLDRQRQQLEKTARNHEAIDPATGLHTTGYLRAELKALSHDVPTHLVMLEIQGLDDLRGRVSYRAAQDLLNRSAQALLALVPGSALVCRYAGDRFVVVSSSPDMGWLSTLRPSLTTLMPGLLSAAGLMPVGLRVASTSGVLNRHERGQDHSQDNSAKLLARLSRQLDASRTSLPGPVS